MLLPQVRKYIRAQKYNIVFTFFLTGWDKNFNPTWVSINIMRYLVFQVVNRQVCLKTV